MKKPKKKIYRISDFIDPSYFMVEAHNFNFTYPSHLFKEDNDYLSFDIFPSTEYFIRTFMLLYSEREMFLPLYEDEAETDEALTKKFGDVVQEYFDGVGSFLADVVGAFGMDYNPLHNYDGDEQRIIEVVHGKTDTLTITHEDDKVILSKEYYGVSGNTSADVETDTTETMGTNTHENVASGTDTTTDTFTRGGNLGLTTNAQLLKGELDLRTKSMYLSFIKKFVDDMTFYGGC